jgi:hypothetical protein
MTPDAHCAGQGFDAIFPRKGRESVFWLKQTP